MAWEYWVKIVPVTLENVSRVIAHVLLTQDRSLGFDPPDGQDGVAGGGASWGGSMKGAKPARFFSRRR